MDSKNFLLVIFVICLFVAQSCIPVDYTQQYIIENQSSELLLVKIYAKGKLNYSNLIGTNEGQWWKEDYIKNLDDDCLEQTLLSCDSVIIYKNDTCCVVRWDIDTERYVTNEHNFFNKNSWKTYIYTHHKTSAFTITEDDFRQPQEE